MPSSVRFAYRQKVLTECKDNLRRVGYVWVKKKKKKFLKKGLLINIQKLIETVSPRLFPGPLHPGREMTTDETNPWRAQCSTDND